MDTTWSALILNTEGATSLKSLIVDDEALARRGLKHRLADIDGVEVVGEARNGREAVKQIRELQPDLVFLDIQMPGMNGFDVVRELRSDDLPAILFVTAYDEFAIDAFEVNAVDYLLKPVKQERLQAAMDAAVRPTRAQAAKSGDMLFGLEPRQHICARVRGSLVLVPIEKIYYFHAEQKYVTVRHTDGEVLIEDALKNLETEFGDRFYRIHRNALVSFERLAGMQSDNDGHKVTFRGIDDTLEVSRRHLPGVRKIIKKL